MIKRVLLLFAFVLINYSCSEKVFNSILNKHPEYGSKMIDTSFVSIKVFDTIIDNQILYKDSTVIKYSLEVKKESSRFDLRKAFKAEKQKNKFLLDSLKAQMKFTLKEQSNRDKFIIDSLKAENIKIKETGKSNKRTSQGEAKENKSEKKWINWLSFLIILFILSVILLRRK